MNSINMLDNMDAVTSLVSVVVLSGFVLLEIMEQNIQHDPILLIILGILASVISFLFFNWFPSKLYMGDNGSQFLGALLASLGIIYFWNPAATPGCLCFSSRQLIIVLLAFLLPVCDTTIVTINRLFRGRSPFVGGRDHTTHHLAYLGLKETTIAILFLIISSISMSFSIVLIMLPALWNITLLLVFSGFSLLVFALLFINTKISKQKSLE
jgi:UDP-GlcNAc:undecaprenyl-phosphate GlcNAc-1-phosphate transferase